MIPPARDAAFVAAMEDVLDVYQRRPDPKRPLVCLDEGGKELHADARPPLPAAPGRPARADPEYARHGAANLFLAVAPHEGRRAVAATEQRTARDFAIFVRDLVDVEHPDAERLVLVTDNLNTHRPASFYRAFPPAEARRILAKLEWHFTPLHGSWLNAAELELSALQRQCLDRRIPDPAALAGEVAAWAEERNAAEVRIDWRFTTEDARARLPFLYPTPAQGSEPLTDYSG